MLLLNLAASPATPATVLTHLVEHALTTRPSEEAPYGRNLVENTRLRSALAGNPAVPVADIHRLTAGLTLLDGRRTILRAALSRPGLHVEDALSIIGKDRSTAALTQAIELVADPDGQLAEYLFTHGTGTTVWDTLLTHPATRCETRWAAATRLATCGKTISARHISHISAAVRDRLLWARTPQEHRGALAWLDDLTPAETQPNGTPSPSHLLRLRERLLKAKRTFVAPKVGSRAWLTDPRTPEPDVIAWANARGPRAWDTAVRHRRDPHATLAYAAQAAAGDDVSVARSLSTIGRPFVVRQRAALARLRGADTPPNHLWRQMLEGGDPGLAVEMLLSGPQLYSIGDMLKRADFTSEHLEAILEHGLGKYRVYAVQRALWVGTYPSATSAQRGAARRAIREANAMDWGHVSADERRLVEPLAAMWSSIDPADPKTLVAAAAGLDLTLAPSYADHYPGIAWLLRSALAEQLPADFTAGAARVLAMLAANFTGTLEELFDTTAVIAA